MQSKSFIKRDDIRGVFPSQLNGVSAKAIGQATCLLLKQKGYAEPVIAVGYDCRHGNIEIAQSFMLGVMQTGGRCVELGQVSTEHVYFACGEHADKYAAGAMMTASHNPSEYNGIKLVHSGCIPFNQQDLAFIAEYVDSFNSAGAFDFDEYARHMLHLSGLDALPPSSSTRLSLLVLAGNGMGAVAFEPIAKLLESRGIRTTILEGTPDGDFPQGVPNPLLPSFMQRLGASTLEAHADLGIGFDGDADRAGFADETGRDILPSQVLVLIASEKLRHASLEHPVIMKNPCCSHLVDDFFARSSAELVETPVGHGRIKQLMRSDLFKVRTIFAGEHSGHYFYPEFNYVDSGILSALYMISLSLSLKSQGRSLSSQLDQWRSNYVWSGEINFTLPSADATRAAIVSASEAFADFPRYAIYDDPETGAQRVRSASGPYGSGETAPDLKYCCDNGASGWWFVLRPSGNEPKLRLNVEAWGNNASAQCQQLVQKITKIIEKEL